jgi:hypothetical protein
LFLTGELAEQFEQIAAILPEIGDADAALAAGVYPGSAGDGLQANRDVVRETPQAGAPGGVEGARSD